MIDVVRMVVAFIRNNTKLVIAAILAIALFSGAVYTKHWYNDQITASYNRGVKDTDDKWTAKQQENKNANHDYKDNQQKSSDELSKQLEEEKAKNAKLQSELDKKQDAYRNSDNGKKKGLDNDFVDIYNESLGLK
ncbi:Rz-like spanin [Escherichia phage 4MG]|uniref:Putative membrane protein n=1 Tax=Escherichia phage 4MG TaxID=1391428 RepID=V5KSJ2_9CAUD|nr:Rz-like spanin [Escherichia phage 4MG]AGZ17550.1 putative membrane protein [Escherichia phage 4MG]